MKAPEVGKGIKDMSKIYSEWRKYLFVIALLAFPVYYPSLHLFFHPTNKNQNPFLFVIDNSWKIRFEADGSLALMRTGWFKNELYPLRPCGNIWCVSLTPAHPVEINIDAQTAPPNFFIPHLEYGGKVSCWRQSDRSIEIYPVKYIDGEWQYFSGEWLPFVDDSDPIEEHSYAPY